MKEKTVKQNAMHNILVRTLNWLGIEVQIWGLEL